MRTAGSLVHDQGRKKLEVIVTVWDDSGGRKGEKENAMILTTGFKKF